MMNLSTKMEITGDHAGHRDAPGAGCRPCCSIPSGTFAILTAVFATFAIALSWTSQRSCHYVEQADFTYCPAAEAKEPAYACCGDCYCISGDEPCPSEVPNMNISDDTISMFKSMTPTNPYNLTCNPYDTQYTGEPCETTPPQTFTELGVSAVCGVIYDTSTLDANQCPTQYTLETFPDIESAEAANATVTHYGSCGVCSTTQDLAAYIEHTDLTTQGVICSFESFLGEFEAGVRCYQRVGFTRPCAAMWVYNAGQTKDYCGRTCLQFRRDKRPNNSPAPRCTLDPCLDCDETESGPLFGKVAARTRRRSGLISMIARPCDDIFFVDHQNPCDVVQGVTREYEQGDVCAITQKDTGDPTQACVQHVADLGLRSYEAPSNGNRFFDISIGLRNDEDIYSTVYGKCKKYNIRNAEDGFWKDVGSHVLGPAYAAAATFGMITVIIGTLMWIFVWTSFCVAYPKNFWIACTVLFTLCGLFQFLTLLFLASPVCDNGCTLGYAAYCAIGAAILWLITAAFSWKTAADDEANAYVPVSYDIRITEYAQPDGTVLTEKITTRSNGTSVIERTTFVKRKHAMEEESANAQSIQSGVLASVASEEPVNVSHEDEEEEDVKKEN